MPRPILLEPLSEGSALKLIDALVPGDALPPAVRARIADGAEGNPLYVEEFVGMLIDDGALVADADGWTASRDLESIAVPPTIQALLSARLDRLAPDERAAAERASVVGRVFEQPAVVALTPPESRSEVPRNLSASCGRSSSARTVRGSPMGDVPLPPHAHPRRRIRAAAEVGARRAARAVRRLARPDARRPSGRGRGDHRLPPGAGVPLSRGAGAGRRTGT